MIDNKSINDEQINQLFEEMVGLTLQLENMDHSNPIESFHAERVKNRILKIERAMRGDHMEVKTLDRKLVSGYLH